MAVILCAAAAQKFTVEIRILGAGFDKDRDQCLDIDCSEWFGSGSFILLLSMDIQEACSLRATAYGRQHRMPCRRELGTPSSNSEDRFGRRRVRLDARSMSDKELDPYEIMLSLIATKGAPGTDEKYRAVMRAVDALHEYHHDPNQGRPARHRQLGRLAHATLRWVAGERLVRTVAALVKNLLAVDVVNFMIAKGKMKAKDRDEILKKHDTAWGTSKRRSAVRRMPHATMLSRAWRLARSPIVRRCMDKMGRSKTRHDALCRARGTTTTAPRKDRLL